MKTYALLAALLLCFIANLSPAQNKDGWHVVNSNLPGNSHGIYFWHPDSGYALNCDNPGNHPAFFVTYNGGTTWDTLAYFDTVSIYFSYYNPIYNVVQVFDKNTIYFLASDNRNLQFIYTTYNAGKNWQARYVRSGVYNFHFFDKARGVLTDEDIAPETYATNDTLKTLTAVGSWIIPKRDVFVKDPVPSSGGLKPWYSEFSIYKGWDSLLAGVSTVDTKRSGYFIESIHRNDTTMFRPKNTSGIAASYDQGKTWEYVDVNSNSYKFYNSLWPNKFGQFYFAYVTTPLPAKCRGFLNYGILDLQTYYADSTDFPADTPVDQYFANDTLGYIFTKTNRILKTTNAGNTLEIRKHVGINPKQLAQESARQVLLIPNPASQKVKVSLPSGEEITEINFYDVSGKCIARQTQAEADISTWPPGTYIVQVCTASHTYSSKLVKE